MSYLCSIRLRNTWSELILMDFILAVICAVEYSFLWVSAQFVCFVNKKLKKYRI